MKYELFNKIFDFYKTAKISIEELKPLEKFITSEENPKFFFTMTEINKIGINPQSKYNTPLGIYAYPLTKEYYTKLITNTLPFAGDKQYINLFSISDKTNNLNNYNNLEHDISVLKKYYKDNVHYNKMSDDLLNDSFNKIKIHAFSTAFQKNDVSRFWNLTRILSKTPLKWNALFRQLGYTNFYDPGEEIIHRAEPTQCVILDPRIIIPIETFLNPYFVKSLKIEKSIKKPIINISEQDINNILKLKNKDIISKFDDSIFNSLKPYQIMYILENNLYADYYADISLFDKIKNNKYINKDKKFLEYFLKNTLTFEDNKFVPAILNFALKHGLNHIFKDTVPFEGNEENLRYSDETLFYFKGNILHRIDGPALERISGHKEWHINGELHREDGPAVESASGSKQWYKNGKRHREDGPAIESFNGEKFWYKNGNLHREDGPAVERADGTKEWWLNGTQHRDDGPAIEKANGIKYWILNSNYYGANDDFTNESWKEFIKTKKK